MFTISPRSIFLRASYRFSTVGGRKKGALEKRIQMILE
jgi:hypothetical protein